MRCPRFAIALLATACALGAAGTLRATDAEPPPFTPSGEFQQFLTDIVREALPTEYEKKKNWGHTKRVFDGWKIEQDGLKIETRRRWKEANDGTWLQYEVRLVKPDDNFQIRIENLQEVPGGKVAFDIAADARVAVSGRQSQWESGLLLYSFSVEADARVRMQAHVEAALKLDPTRIPPDVYLVPVVTTADLQIPDFRLHKVSHLHGPVVRSLSHSVREMLEEKVASDRAKLVASLNKQIAKNEKKLKFSAQDLLQSQWSTFRGK